MALRRPDLVDAAAVGVGQRVEARVDVVEQVDHLHRPERRAVGVEVADAAEEDADGAVLLGVDGLAGAQAFGDARRQDRVDQVVRQPLLRLLLATRLLQARRRQLQLLRQLALSLPRACTEQRGLEHSGHHGF